VYRQIADEVVRGVAVGILKPGERLPAARQRRATERISWTADRW
jgi:DNA-binding transcriptional regulator YhcF (GntR family)